MEQDYFKKFRLALLFYSKKQNDTVIVYCTPKNPVHPVIPSKMFFPLYAFKVVLGSSRSLSPSPTRLMVRVRSIRHRPGKAVKYGAISRNDLLSLSITPQLGIGG